MKLIVQTTNHTHPDEEIVETSNIIESYTLKLPSVKDADSVKQREVERETENERITRKGKYVHALLKSPFSSNHTREKENQHRATEKQKTL